MKKKILLAAVSLILFSASSQADETVSLKLGYAYLNPGGTFASSDVGSATRLGVDSLLAMKNSSGVTAEAALQFGDHRFAIAVLPISATGSRTLSVPITFAGKTYTAGTKINSSLKSTLYDIGYTYYFVNMDDLPSRLQLGLEFSVKINKIDATISSTTLGSSSINTTAPIPTLGFRGRVALADFVGLVGRVGYLTVGKRGSYLDADAQVEFSPLPMVGIYGGYHYIKIKVKTTSVYTDMHFAGPYIGGLARF
ncbi:MAG: hypothetical protein Q9M26_04465 [Mariprofundales bacterium]|nr:hypothetical protein [Mariprofundales bacterium]